MTFNLALWTCALAATVWSIPSTAGEPVPPRIEVVIDRVHGVEIRDPYRWMETGGIAFDSWAHAEAAHARNTLDTLPGRAELYRRIVELDQADSAISGLQVRNDRWLYQRTPAGEEGSSLFMRDGRDGDELRIDLLSHLPVSEGPWSEVVAARVLSPDGRFLTFGTTQKGEATPALRVFDLIEGRLLPEVIAWPLWADANGFRPRWRADSRGFYYIRRADADTAMSDTERARRGLVFLHLLGTSVESDHGLFGYGKTSAIDDADTLYVQGEPDPRWLIVWRRMPAGRELWALDIGAEKKNRVAPARRIWHSDVGSPGYGVLGNALYVADATDSPRFRVLRYNLADATSKAEVVLPQQEGVISHLMVAGDAVYIVESLLSRARLHIIAETGTRRIELDAGAVNAIEAGIDGRGAWISQVDWLRPARGQLLKPGASALSDPGIAPAPVASANNFASSVEWAIARDGEQIPYTIVKRVDARPDRSAYVMLDGYGCFGSAQPPFHWPSLIAWLERGGVFVRVAMRGGGELGADWHRAGRDRNKAVAYEDAIDVARALVRTGVTQPGHIGVTGASCGGMTMGMAAIEAPHLIAAAALSVGAFDPARLDGHSAAGARSIRDIGDPDTAEGMRRIIALSPYHQLLEGAPRPAFLISNGATDYAIPLWSGGKMVARARAALPNGKPVLWNIDWQGGHTHGIDFQSQDADQFAFLFWQLGHPAFQPDASH